jgi:hypothetical protein
MFYFIFFFSISNLVRCYKSKHYTFESSKNNNINTFVFFTRTEVEMRKLVCCIASVLLPMTSRLALTVSCAAVAVESQVRSFQTSPHTYKVMSRLSNPSLKIKWNSLLNKKIFISVQILFDFCRTLLNLFLNNTENLGHYMTTSKKVIENMYS